ncbi:uncharacterized protein EDB93DRAFT_1081558, partial [Suillus bovinus]|uniref:uncharacterized protein n=1 Tax=Suillus bovinus TaxID=48563 RepID=UPI001B87EB66
TVFKGIWEDQIDAGLEENPWALFDDEDEWGLAQGLAKQVNKTTIDEFLKLSIPSYTSNYTFQNKLNKLPKGPGWTCNIVISTGNQTDGNKEFITKQHELWRRDPVVCICELIGNPSFKDSLACVPEKVYMDSEGQTQVYDDVDISAILSRMPSRCSSSNVRRCSLIHLSPISDGTEV